MSNTKSAESTLSEPIFNRQALVRLILPLLAEQFLSVTMGMADTLMVSGVGEAAVSSVSLVDSLNILIIQILSALATGGAVISSQYLGRRDGEKSRQKRRTAVHRSCGQHHRCHAGHSGAQPPHPAHCFRPH